MHGWIRYIHVAISLFVISDPLGAIPLFLAITKEQTTKETARAAIATAATVAMVLTLTVFLGVPLLRVFGIRIASFRVGGGILILMMAIAMLYARPDRTTAQEAAEATGNDHVVVPLAVPLIAGPGAISSVILYAQQSESWLDKIVLTALVLLLAISVWISLRLAQPISRLLGTTGINIITRLLGLLLSAIAIEFITTGLVELLPGLAGR